MSSSTLGTQFALELAFGVFVAMICVHRAPLGLFFFRLMGSAALVLVLFAAVLPLATGALAWHDPTFLGSAVGVLTYPYYAGGVRSRRRLLALVAASVGSGAALIAIVRSAERVISASDWTLASFSVLFTGSVAGSVGLAMVLGHWYLTIPDLALSHLVRLNRIALWCMAACLASVVLSYFVFVAGQRGPGELDAWGTMCLGTRVAVGLIVPMLFSWMAAQSLRYRNTRSATGILYASTVLVLIGTAVAISLQDTYGVPL